VANGLFSIPEERQRYRERVAELLANECSVEKLHARVDRLADRLRPALARERELREQIDASVASMKSRMRARATSLARQLNESERSVTFGESGAMPLSAWRFKAALDRPALGTRTVEQQRQLLQVRARGDDAFSSGAWRSVVLLEQGHYELSGMARALGLDPSATNTGVILRISGERSTQGLSTNENWTLLRYEFDVLGIQNTELICEFRGAQGSGQFDVSTLKLTRQGPAREAKVENE
jgi:hypothetical protein